MEGNCKILKSRSSDLPFDCWGEIITFVETSTDFFSLVNSVRGFYEFVRNVNPRCSRHILFVANDFPDHGFCSSFVHRVKISQISGFEFDELSYFESSSNAISAVLQRLFFRFSNLNELIIELSKNFFPAEIVMSKTLEIFTGFTEPVLCIKKLCVIIPSENHGNRLFERGTSVILNSSLIPNLESITVENYYNVFFSQKNAPKNLNQISLVNCTSGFGGKIFGFPFSDFKHRLRKLEFFFSFCPVTEISDFPMLETLAVSGTVPGKLKILNLPKLRVLDLDFKYFHTVIIPNRTYLDDTEVKLESFVLLERLSVKYYVSNNLWKQISRLKNLKNLSVHHFPIWKDRKRMSYPFYANIPPVSVRVLEIICPERRKDDLDEKVLCAQYKIGKPSKLSKLIISPKSSDRYNLSNLADLKETLSVLRIESSFPPNCKDNQERFGRIISSVDGFPRLTEICFTRIKFGSLVPQKDEILFRLQNCPSLSLFDMKRCENNSGAVIHRSGRHRIRVIRNAGSLRFSTDDDDRIYITQFSSSIQQMLGKEICRTEEELTSIRLENCEDFPRFIVCSSLMELELVDCDPFIVFGEINGEDFQSLEILKIVTTSWYEHQKPFVDSIVGLKKLRKLQIVCNMISTCGLTCIEEVNENAVVDVFEKSCNQRHILSINDFVKLLKNE